MTGSDRLTLAAPRDDGATADIVLAALRSRRHAETVDGGMTALAIAAWLVVLAVAAFVPDTTEFPVEGTPAIAALASLAVAWLASLAVIARVGAATIRRWAVNRLNRSGRWAVASGAWIVIWVWTTAKIGVLKPPYFASPQQILADAWKDHGLLLASLGNSVLLLALGYTLGVLAGLVTGTTMGWSRQADYWVHPVLQYVGPVPALAWVPIIFVTFPTAYAGAVFLIALGVWFPVTLLTRAGIMSVPRSYYDVAQTLGGNTSFLIFRISIPAAVPSVFTGAFMALGIAFATLTVAENFGVNSGLGWYINWKKGWSAYPAMYGGILVLVVFCGGLMTLLLRARARVLAWQKDLVRW